MMIKDTIWDPLKKMYSFLNLCIILIRKFCIPILDYDVILSCYYYIYNIMKLLNFFSKSIH